MATSQAKTVPEYLASLSPASRATVEAVRRLVRANIPKGFEEGMLYGMIGWYIPLATYPETYNGQPLSVVCLAAQKNYFSLYLPTHYGDGKLLAWLEAAYRKAGKKLDMGKSCLRFRSVDDLALEVVGGAIARVGVDDLIRLYEAGRRAAAKGPTRRGKAARRKRAAPTA